jgi:hypothetical protein
MVKNNKQAIVSSKKKKRTCSMVENYNGYAWQTCELTEILIPRFRQHALSLQAALNSLIEGE